MGRKNDGEMGEEYEEGLNDSFFLFQLRIHLLHFFNNSIFKNKIIRFDLDHFIYVKIENYDI
jgi:hypothetical protein